MLKVALEKKQKKPASNKKRGRPRKGSTKEIKEKNKAENTLSSATNSDIEEEENMSYRLRSRREK